MAGKRFTVTVNELRLALNPETSLRGSFTWKMVEEDTEQELSAFTELGRH